METIGIVGAGLMGADIAQLAAESGMDVILHDVDQAHLKQAYEIITGRLDRYVKEDRIDKNMRGQIASRVKLHNNLKDMVNADFIIERKNVNFSGSLIRSAIPRLSWPVIHPPSL